MRTTTILLTVLAASLSACDGATTQTSDQPAITKKADGWEIAMKAVEVAPDIGPSGLVPSAANGATYVHITYSLKNTGNEGLSYGKWPKAQLVDAAGHKFEHETFATAAMSASSNPTWADNLNPNLSTEVHMVWKVDEKSFDRGTWRLVLQTKPETEFPL